MNMQIPEFLVVFGATITFVGLIMLLSGLIIRLWIGFGA